MGKKIVFSSAMCKCNQGSSPCKITPGNTVNSPDGIILLEDSKPIGIFGICQILTQMANGIPTSCAPAYAPLWTGTSEKVKVKGKKPLLESSKLACGVGGEISLIKISSKVEEG